MLRTKFSITSLAITIFVCLFSVFPVSAETSQNIDVHNLHLVNKIYIEDIEGVNEQGLIKPAFRQELKNIGITLVDAPEKADVILTGSFLAYVILDGDPTQPSPKPYFQLRLISLSKEKIWKVKITLPRDLDEAKRYTYVAQKFAKKLSDERNKSAKKSGKRP